MWSLSSCRTLVGVLNPSEPEESSPLSPPRHHFLQAASPLCDAEGPSEAPGLSWKWFLLGHQPRIDSKRSSNSLIQHADETTCVKSGAAMWSTYQHLDVISNLNWSSRPLEGSGRVRLRGRPQTSSCRTGFQKLNLMSYDVS